MLEGSHLRARIFAAIAILFLLYIATYAAYRNVNTEIWDKDGRAYVIFPEKHRLLYYFYRPLSYIDSKLTGIGFHIGPHR